MATSEQLRRITLENGRVIYIGEQWLADMQVFEGRIQIDLGNGIVHSVAGTDIDAFYNTTFTVAPTEVTITNALLNVQLSEPVTIDGTIGVSGIGGTVATNTTIANNPLDIREQPIPLTFTTTVTSLNAVSVTIAAANPTRKYLLVRNTSHSDATIYVRLSATAATTTTSIPLKKGEYFELPDGFTYLGAITAISAAFGADSVTVLEGV